MNGKTQLFPDAPGNLCVDWPGPVADEQNERDVAEIIAKAPHVARVSVTHQRLVVASMETRGATGVYDKESDSYTLHACSQSADALRGQAASIMGVPNDKLRVITEDVGGAFGMKTTVYPEYIAVLVGARKVGRPVHWQSTRSEAFMSDCQARDAVTHVELALDDKGKFLGLRVRHLCNQGAYIANAGININTNNFARCLPGMYRIAEGRRRRRLLFLQQGADRALSRRRTPGGELRARARGRGSRARRRHGPGAAAQEEPHSGVGDAVQDADQHLRQRRFSRHRRQGAHARRLRQFQQAQARIGQAQEAARHRHILHAGAFRRDADGNGLGGVSRRPQDDPRSECAIDRAEPRHRVRPAAGAQARHRCGPRSSTTTATPIWA